MITARFPSGVAVRYLKAHYVVWGNSATHEHLLYTAAPSEGSFVARIPLDCAIEFEEGTPVTTLSDVDALEKCANEPHRLRWLQYGAAKRLKQAFRSFDIRTGRWKTK